MKTVKINVLGSAGSGKSRILYLIKTMLEEEGFVVDHDPTPDHESTYDFDTVMEENLDEVVDFLAENTKVQLFETQMRRSIYAS